MRKQHCLYNSTNSLPVFLRLSVSLLPFSFSVKKNERELKMNYCVYHYTGKWAIDFESRTDGSSLNKRNACIQYRLKRITHKVLRNIFNQQKIFWLASEVLPALKIHRLFTRLHLISHKLTFSCTMTLIQKYIKSPFIYLNVH